MANIEATSESKVVPAVRGTHAQGGEGLHGESTADGTGVVGVSIAGVGVWGRSTSSSGLGGVSDSGHGVHGVSTSNAGVRGDSSGEFLAAGVAGINGSESQSAGPGVYGKSRGTGVWGESTTWHAVAGLSDSQTGGAGVYGRNVTGGPGVIGESKTWHGVYGSTESGVGGAGVTGEHKGAGNGVLGKSVAWNGVHGQTAADGGNGVFGENTGGGSGLRGHAVRGAAVWAFSEQGEGVHAETRSAGVAAVAAVHLNDESEAAALYARKGGKGWALVAEGHARFVGRVHVAEDILLENADFAEDFDVVVETDPGTVMVLGEEGGLVQSSEAYDRRVAGVVCGAGHYRPGIVMDKRADRSGRQPIALVGKVFVKVDADQGAVRIGDLLTSSSTPGHAMKAADPARAFGAVLGKALGSLDAGRGLVPVLVSLQ